MKMIKFYDTSSLLLNLDHLFSEDKFAISSITLEELEHIKTSANKDADIKYAARKLVSILDSHMGEYDVEIYQEGIEKPLIKKGIFINNDAKIIACALKYQKKLPKGEKIQFITNDICLKHIANIFLPGQIDSIYEENKEYTGYKDIQMSDEEMTKFYSNPTENIYDLHINQYLIVRNAIGDIVDRLCWTDRGYRKLTYETFSSSWFGNIKPMKDDIYQAFLADSFINNQITLVKGPAGSGKTFLSLAFLLHKLEKGELDKIIIFCNTVATRDSAKLGYYPGTRDEKLLDSQIGNLLASKFGGRVAVEQMIMQEQLVLLPMSDIRGYDTTGMRAGVYISEAQNMTVNLMKLALQRIGEDSVCIIDGDCKTQVDDVQFAGSNNGMKRASKVFRGKDIYGEISLVNVHRSKIAAIAEDL